MVPVEQVPYAVQEIAKHFRPLYKGTLVINGRFNRESGNHILEQGFADAVAFGKPFISNPDLVERIRRGAKRANGDEKTFYKPGSKGYTDYPTFER